ncbi:hypothetical protein HQ865_16980 [Mucilaginibacter mali]|uniref:Uncharacterized protein n=1 Tax=Mucilaginibacter mali TaxID=2740462 RepID=A0A7D4QB63_9SPHI|nr:hypothetical protein [Mucilaginibacter mali]QKJ31385.1 hypothetical protein HQ865_16980 [Mucilaginibacter mali]
MANKIKLTADISFLKDLSDFTPVWDSARTALDTNYYVVEAPARYVKKWGFNADSNTTNINGLTRLLVLKSKKYGSTSAVLMHIHGKPGVNAANVHYMDVPQTFSGNIFYTGLQGGFINGYVYKNGKIILASSGKSNTVKPSGPQILTAAAPGECETIEIGWYMQVCYYTSSDVLTGCDDWIYLYSTFETYCVPGQPGGGGGVAPPTDCDNGGGGGVYEPPVEAESINGKLVVRGVPPPDSTSNGGTPCEPVQDIKNKVNDPCLHKMVDSAINRNIEYDASESMKGIFDSNSDFNLTFLDNTLSSTIDGTSQVQHAGASIQQGTGKRIITSMDINITLNSQTLPNASQEYITATILHEVLHSYFIQAGYIGDDHDTMFNKYIPWFESALHAIYPQLDNNDLQALAYGGLLDSQAFKNSTEGANGNLYFTINNLYKYGNKGKKCGSQ